MTSSQRWLALKNPFRLNRLCTAGQRPILIEEIHAFLWLSLKYQESKSARYDPTGRIHTSMTRLLGEWLEGAEFEDGAVH